MSDYSGSFSNGHANVDENLIKNKWKWYLYPPCDKKSEYLPLVKFAKTANYIQEWIV